MCFGDCIAAEELTINGGTQPYTYTLDLNPSVFLSINASIDTLTNLCVGSYDLLVADANGCLTTPTPTNFLISGASLLAAGLTTKTDVTCNGSNNGTASVVNATGGTQFTLGDPYLYFLRKTRYV